ncbi:MAG: hypothetical protein FWC62_02030 [Firmicutes bacterium]|nr:hypothetical protein [Bacillota bacterium]
MAKKKLNDHGTGIPPHEIESLARVLFPEIQRFFESENGKREFEEWKMKNRELLEKRVTSKV